jgi:hypothetical protein
MLDRVAGAIDALRRRAPGMQMPECGRRLRAERVVRRAKNVGLESIVERQDGQTSSAVDTDETPRTRPVGVG